MAWMFASTATNLCQTLGYHRLSSAETTDDADSLVKKSLFWEVYTLDKSLSLRLGRASNIPELGITILPDPDEIRCVTLARIQGKVYDQLYSPWALTQSDALRIRTAESLAGELQKLISLCQREDFVRFDSLCHRFLRGPLRWLI